MKYYHLVILLILATCTYSIRLSNLINVQPSFSPCRTCVQVLKEMKQGQTALLPNICSLLLARYPDDPDIYPRCNEVIYSISEESDHVKSWILSGCWKKEKYDESEHMIPCPFHVICSKLKGLDNKSYCPITPMDDPFADEKASTTGAAGAAGTGAPATTP